MLSEIDLAGNKVERSKRCSALETAGSGPVEEGSVGAGTGTRAFGWKGGIGTSSRTLPEALGGRSTDEAAGSGVDHQHEVETTVTVADDVAPCASCIVYAKLSVVDSPGPEPA